MFDCAIIALHVNEARAARNQNISFKMAASSSKRSVAEQIFDKLMLGFDDEIPIILIEDKREAEKGEKKKVRQAGTAEQPPFFSNEARNYPDDVVDFPVPVSCSVKIIQPAFVAVPSFFRDINH